MKKVKFKKWIILATISFILSVTLITISAVSTGAKIFNSVQNFENGIGVIDFANSDSHQIDGDWNFKIGSNERGTCQYSIDNKGIRVDCSKN